MLDRIVELSLKGRWYVILGLLALLAYGSFEYRRMAVDAFPDISPIMVQVFADYEGMAPEEIERLIAYPIEAAMSGLPGVTQVKSTSTFGLAVVYVYFRDDVDIYFARQLVAERLTRATAELPPTEEPAILGPISSGLGQVFLYYLTMEEGADLQGKDRNTYLREINDHVVKKQLQKVPGVTDILSIGGFVFQYQLDINPHALQKYSVSISDIEDAIRNNNKNAGGQFLVLGSEEYLVRGIGLIQDLEQLKNVFVKSENGVPVKLSDLGTVSFGKEIRRGVITRNGREEVVSGMVLKLWGENTSSVIQKLYEKIEDVQRSLPAGIKIVPYYEQAELVRMATGTVKNAIIEGSVLVVLILLLFLGNARSAFIVALSLPLCALIAVIFMSIFRISANLMSLGGIAIAIGMLSDGAIVMVENIFRHLGNPGSKLTKAEVILVAAKEVTRPIVFSIAIIITVFLPLFTLQGIEGKMFSPMAFTISFALLGSIFAAIVFSPVLAHFFLKEGGHFENPLIRHLKACYSPLLCWVIGRKEMVLTAAALIFCLSLPLLLKLGTEFIPTLEEGAITIGATMAPSISLDKATETVWKLENLIKSHPEIAEVISRIGRPESGTCPHPVNYAEMYVKLVGSESQINREMKKRMVEELRKDLSTVPGVQLNFTQPIQNAFDELLSGIRAQLAIKIYGEDLDVLQKKAVEVKAAVSKVAGLVDLSVEQSFGQPQLQIVPDRDACARYGINVDQIQELVELAIGGKVVDYLYQNTRRVGIQLRYQESFRDNPEAIGTLLISSKDGNLIPLSQIAEIKTVTGHLQIKRENNQRRWIVQGNIRNRDLGSVVADVKKAVLEKISLPTGYYVEYGGQFENQERAMKTLSIIVPTVIFLVFLILWIAFNSVSDAFLIIVNVPLALVGGVVGLLVTGEYLSVPASVGFIALFGIAVQNGMVLVSYINQLFAEGQPLKDAIVRGCLLRLRPVLLTAGATILGVLPLLLSHGAGSEVQRPLAVVVVYGLITSTVLTLFIIPAFYALIKGKSRT
ncbi:MAG: CusA/CzcA family heavy metal efflux RND transporter [Candidatus Wallbacteria bacterium]|nr:CusA/CzcA family heavy metal efflux RND transporter [Candidatus Wallbacteria bacterium]